MDSDPRWSITVVTKTSVETTVNARLVAVIFVLIFKMARWL